MIVKRMWMVIRPSRKGEPRKWAEAKRIGYFLFGLIPLYIEEIEIFYHWNRPND